MSFDSNPTWVKQQARSFTAWVNMQLQGSGRTVLDYTTLESGLENGVALCYLVNVLSNKKELGLTAIKPTDKGDKTMRLHKIENAGRAIKRLQDAFALNITTSAEEIVDGKLKLILGLLWMIIAKVSVDDISEEELTARDGLLAWCKRMCAQSPYDIAIKDFHHSWQSGLGYLAIAHAYDRSSFDWAAAVAEYEAADEDAKKAARISNLTKAFELVEEKMQIPKTFLDPEEMADLAIKPDEKSNVVYLSQIYSRFAGRQQYDQAANAVNRVVNQLRQIERIQSDYEVKAQAILDFVAEHAPAYAELATFATEDDARAAVAAAKDFLYSEPAPEQTAALAEAEALFQAIQTRRKADNRSPYEAPEALEPATVAAAFNGCLAAIRAYIAHVNSEIVRHYELARAIMQHDALVTKTTHFLQDTVEPALARPIGANGSMIALQERVAEAILADQAHAAEVVAALPELAQKIAALGGEDHSEAAAALVADVAAVEGRIAERKAALEAARKAEEEVFARVSAGAQKMAELNTRIHDIFDIARAPVSRDSLEEAKEGFAALEGAKTTAADMAEEVDATFHLAHDLESEQAELLADFTVVKAAGIADAYDALKVEIDAALSRADDIIERLNTEAAAAADVKVAAAEAQATLDGHVAATEAAAALATDEALQAYYDAQKAMVESDIAETVSKLTRSAAVTENEEAINVVQAIVAELGRITTLAAESIATLQRQKLDAADLEVPAETVAEWQATFAKFDKDNSGTLQRYELEAMLVAADQVVPAHKIDALYASTDGIDFATFSGLMNALRKQGTTAEGIKDAFSTLAEGSETIGSAALAQHFPEDVATYLKSKLEASSEDAYLYAPFAEAAFA